MEIKKQWTSIVLSSNDKLDYFGRAVNSGIIGQGISEDIVFHKYFMSQLKVAELLNSTDIELYSFHAALRLTLKE